jgi:hypothetical protein
MKALTLDNSIRFHMYTANSVPESALCNPTLLPISNDLRYAGMCGCAFVYVRGCVHVCVRVCARACSCLFLCAVHDKSICVGKDISFCTLVREHAPRASVHVCYGKLQRILPSPDDTCSQP